MYTSYYSEGTEECGITWRGWYWRFWLTSLGTKTWRLLTPHAAIFMWLLVDWHIFWLKFNPTKVNMMNIGCYFRLHVWCDLGTSCIRNRSSLWHCILKTWAKWDNTLFSNVMAVILRYTLWIQMVPRSLMLEVQSGIESNLSWSPKAR